MECPKCGLENPPRSLRCDCGYPFFAGVVLTDAEEKAPSIGVAGNVAVKTFTYTKRFGTFMRDGKAQTMDDHIAEMLSEGWQVLNTQGGGGHINVGRTALRAVTLGLVFGASRAAETMTITFSRSRG